MKKLFLLIICFTLFAQLKAQQEFEGVIIYKLTSPSSNQADTMKVWFSKGRVKISSSNTLDTDDHYQIYQSSESICLNDSLIIIDLIKKKAAIVSAQSSSFKMLNPIAYSSIPLNLTRNILGVECKAYLDSIKFLPSLPPLSAIEADTFIQHSQSWQSSSLIFHASIIVDNYLGIIIDNKITLERDIKDEEGNSELLIQAISIKNESLPDSIFEIPPGFQIIREKDKSATKVTIEEVTLEKVEYEPSSAPPPPPVPTKPVKKKKKQ